MVLGDIDVGDGSINISAGGTISGGNIQTRFQMDQNDVRLVATGDSSDILIDQINVGNIGDAVLIADDDVVIGGGENQITADVIFVNAKTDLLEEPMALRYLPALLPPSCL